MKISPVTSGNYQNTHAKAQTFSISRKFASHSSSNIVMAWGHMLMDSF